MNNKYYVGDILETATIEKSPEDCQKICQTTENCLFFTWSKTDHYCIRRSYYSIILDDNNVVSGPKHCKDRVGGSQFFKGARVNNASPGPKLNASDGAKPRYVPGLG